MVISRTPLRVSFFGGGTDYPVWYKNHGGMVISASINKYTYITVRYLPPFFPYNYRIRYTRQEYRKSLDEIVHPSVRECLRFLKLKKGVEIQHNADLPARSGIGSSSSFTVGLINALFALQGNIINSRKLALAAIYVEQNLIKENVGSQDQTIVAYGGFNKIRFSNSKTFSVHPLKIDEVKLAILQKNLMLFFTGFVRNASDIAAEQISNTKNKTRSLSKMIGIAKEAEKVLFGKNTSVDDFGRLLHESWMLKKTLSNKISTDSIDKIYENAMQEGALGGKLLGAGGGGFMLLYIPEKFQKNILEKLKRLQYVPFRFEFSGSRIIYKMPNDMYESYE